MPTSIVRKFTVFVSLACAAAHSVAQMADTRWRVRVTDLQHEVKAEGTIRLTGKRETESCMAGNWKQAVVETKTIINEKFFPLAEPLAYEVDNGQITFGRPRVCDGYLFLTGKLDKTIIRGAFHGQGPGYDVNLGYFSLTKIH